jgi:hypothetical protein
MIVLNVLYFSKVNSAALLGHESWIQLPLKLSDVMDYALTCVWNYLMLWIMHLLAFDAVWCYELCIYLPLKLSDVMDYALTCVWSCLMLWIMHLLAFDAVWCCELCVNLPLKLYDAVNYAFEAVWFHQSSLHLPLKPSHASCQSTSGTVKHPFTLSHSDFIIPTWNIVYIKLVTNTCHRDP